MSLGAVLRPRSTGLPDPVAIDTAELNANWHSTNQRRRQQVLIALVLITSVVVSALVLWFQVLTVIGLLTWLAIVAIAMRPYVGLCVAFGLTLLFEAGGADQLMLPGFYLNGGLGSTLGLTGAIASPLELLLVLTFMVWFGQGVMRRQFDFRGGALARPMLAFLAALVLGLVRGILGGGDVNIALWESRFLFYAIICYVVAANTVRSRRQINALLWIMLLATTAWSIEGAWRRVALIDTGLLGVVPEFAYSHEDVIFLGTHLLLVIALWTFKAPFVQRLFGLASVPVVGFTLLATERRAGYIALIIAFVMFTLVFLIVNRKAFFLFSLPMLIAFAVYLPVFWDNTTMVGQPARAVRSLSAPDPRDASSNLYRQLEKFNVIYTIKSNPILGVGFGRPFDFVVALPDLSWWPFWHYEPHHNILWVWLKLGTGGFIIFWTLLATAVARSTYIVRTLRTPEARIWGLFALTAVVTTVVFCYVDLGLVSGRVTVFLGTTLGVLSILHFLNDRPNPELEASHASLRRHLYS
jgi:O-Antigen ligase